VVTALTHRPEATMTVHDLETLFDYGYWANRKLFEAIAPLTPDQLARTVDDSHGSIRNTLVHMLNVERIWLGRCGGPFPEGIFNPADFATADSIVARWNTHEPNMRAFLATLTDADLAREIEFTIGGTKRPPLPLSHLLQQAAVHGVHHRGQVSLLLRLLGGNPENFDILLYHMEKQRPAS
jgi:uncharacterized damage-inducible protein DinB